MTSKGRRQVCQKGKSDKSSKLTHRRKRIIDRLVREYALSAGLIKRRWMHVSLVKTYAILKEINRPVGRLGKMVEDIERQ